MNNYTIYNASAGAGKTYTLVKNFISILLKGNSPNSVYTLLAVTFTNKAANEMKSRILKWLKDFSDSENYLSNPILKDIAKETNLDLDLLHERAQKALSFILHHYSLLSISTIDKFNLRLMKSFTKELGLSYSFSIELDASDYLKQSIDELLNELGTDNPFAEVILNYILWKFENESSTDIKNELLSSSKNFLKEMHLEPINSIIEKDFEDFKKLNQILRQRIKSNHKLISEQSTEIIQLLESRRLEIADFFQGAKGMGGFFYKALDERARMNINFSSSYYTKFCEEEKYAKAKSPREDEIISIAPCLIEAFYNIKQLVNRIKVDESVRRNLITLELQSEISHFLTHKKKERDVLFISDVNPMLSKHLKEEPVAFIYEKLGGRYDHYFIDEFQDTSQLQWDNILPLLENAKISAGTSITLVGDPKQAIYRFRSGNPEILMNLISDATELNIQLIGLQDNYRSLPNIVDFNNKFYQFLSDSWLDLPEYKELFGSKAQQNSKMKGEGRVQISFVSPADEEGEYIANRAVEIIEEVLQKGFSFHDIVILIRNRRHGVSIVQALLEKQYPILTEEALQVSSSPAVQALINALYWLYDPQDKERLFFMLYHLWKIKKIQVEDLTLEMIKIKDLSFSECLTYLQEELQLPVSSHLYSYLSFYDFVEELARALHLGEGEELYISTILDMILQMEKTGVISLQEFLEHWELKGESLSVRFPENMNAIQIMTIHKSKGLEFPVVIYPMLPPRNSNEEYWFPLEQDLYYGFNQYYTSSKTGLEEVSDEIKEVVEHKTREAQIDELCVQYVATTRASNQLFIIQEKDKKETLLELFLKKEGFEAEGIIDIYPQGITDKQNKKEGEHVEEQQIEWISQPWSKRIRVSTDAHKRYVMDDEEIEYGNMIHSLLSEIITKEDLPKVIKKFTLLGFIEVHQQNRLEQLLYSVIEHPKLASYFSGIGRVYTEQEILFEGKLYRPDRLLEQEEGFTIIDFKTGEAHSIHKKQVEKYAQALEVIGKTVKEKILVYIKPEGIDLVYV